MNEEEKRKRENEQKRNWRKNNLDKVNENLTFKYWLNEKYRLKKKYTLIIKRIFKQIDNDNFKDGKHKDLIGISIKNFKHYIEDQFTQDMCWSNRNIVWEINYVKKFMDNDVKEIPNLIHYSNIRVVKK